jgi:hypothetical protein
LSDGRNFGQKAQKMPGKNKVGRENLWPNFSQILPKVAEKGPKNMYTLLETKKNFYFISN